MRRSIHCPHRAPRILLAVMPLLIVPTVAMGATFVVVNTANSGDGSLAWAITQAEANAGPDTITFNIPGAGPHAITAGVPLPTITQPVVIDGYTQSGASPATSTTLAVLKIILNGTSSSGGHGLSITGGSCRVRGLVIGDFPQCGILLQTGGNNVIEGNYIGIDVTGDADQGNSSNGIEVSDSPGNTIGGLTPAARNVVSHNNKGIHVHGSGSTGNFIQGNLVGTNAAGSADRGNFSDGIKLTGANNNTIGGTTAGARNVVSGNGYQAGIYLSGSSGNLVQGNYAGTDITGTFAIRNDYDGIIIHNSPNNTIGGTAPGAGNVFSGNGDEGIDVYQSGSYGNIIQGNFVGLNAAGTGALGNTGDGIYFDNSNNNMVGGTMAAAQNRVAYNVCRGIKTKGSGNAFLGNSVFSNAQLGIDLYPDGVTANDLGDGDTGANNLQNYPVLSSVNSNASYTIVQGALNSTAATDFRLEFFSSPTADGSGYGEGQVYLGHTMVTTDGSGDVAFTATLPTPVPNGHCVAATATNPANSTSEFSQVAYAVTLALAAELTGGEVVLTWTPIAPAQAYWVYGASNDPVFAPGYVSPYAYRRDVVPAGTTTWSSADGVDDITNDWTYLVVAVGAGESIMATSNRVGEETYEGDIP